MSCRSKSQGACKKPLCKPKEDGSCAPAPCPPVIAQYCRDKGVVDLKKAPECIPCKYRLVDQDVMIGELQSSMGENFTAGGSLGLAMIVAQVPVGNAAASLRSSRARTEGCRGGP